MPDPIRKRFGYSVQPESGQILYARFPTSVSVPCFQSKQGSYCARPTLIQSGWSGQGLAKHIWSGSKLVCRNHQVQFLAGCNRPAILVSHFQTRFCSSRDIPDNVVQNQPGSNLVLADCVRFWPNRSSPEAS